MMKLHKGSLGVNLLMEGFMLVFLIGIYLVNPAFSRPAISSMKQPAASSLPLIPCVSADVAYCTQLRRFVSAAENGDYSILIASQPAMVKPSCFISTITSCSKPGQAAIYYEVYENNVREQLMRNDYIKLFRMLSAVHGSYSFEQDSAEGTTAVLHFQAADQRERLDLLLKKTDEGWELQAPRITLL